MDEAGKYKQRLEAIAVSYIAQARADCAFICEKVNCTHTEQMWFCAASAVRLE